jgi:hypothetical protein
LFHNEDFVVYNAMTRKFEQASARKLLHSSKVLAYALISCRRFISGFAEKRSLPCFLASMSPKSVGYTAKGLPFLLKATNADQQLPELSV